MNIHNVAYVIPDHHETIADAAKRIKLPAHETIVFEKMFGLKQIPVDHEATCEQFMLKAAAKCLVEANIDKQKVKWLIHSHTSDHAVPFGMSAVRRVQRALHLDNAVAFAASMYKCCTIFALFELANSLMANLEDDEYILLLTGDVAFTREYQFIPVPHY